MSDLRKLAQPLLDRPPLPPRPVAEIRRAARKRQRQYRAAAAATLAVCALVVAAALAADIGGAGRRPKVHTTDRAATDAAYVSQLEVGEATGAAVGPNAVWVLGNDVVREVDPKRNAVVATFALLGTGGVHQITTGLGAVWISDGSGGQVTRIDPSTHRVVATVNVDGPTSMAVAGGRIWVVSSHPDPESDCVSAVCISRALVPIDPVTNRAGNPIVLPRSGAPTEPLLASGGGAVLFVSRWWSILRVDTAAGVVRASPDLELGTAAIVALGRHRSSVYALTSVGTILDLDSSSLVVRRASEPIPGAERMAVGAGHVWIVSVPSNLGVSRFQRMSLESLLPIGDAVDAGPLPGQVAVGRGTVWVVHSTLASLSDQGSLTRIDNKRLSSRPELCPGSTARSPSASADGLPPVSSVIPSRSRAIHDLRVRKATVLRHYPHARDVSLGRGYGRAWMRDSRGNVVVVAVKDYAIVVRLDHRRSCPSPSMLNGSSSGLPLFFSTA
jgi:hypothetical protein